MIHGISGNRYWDLISKFAFIDSHNCFKFFLVHTKPLQYALLCSTHSALTYSNFAGDFGD